MENLFTGPDGTRSDGSSDRRRTEPLSENRRFPLVLGVVVALACGVLLTRGKSTVRNEGGVAPTLAPLPAPSGPFVGLTIDFGNQIRREYDALPWREGMTVGQAMDAAASAIPGITFQEVGEGAGALLISLEGVANQGGGGRNWLYQVDGRHAQASFRIHPLEEGERILWIFSLGE